MKRLIPFLTLIALLASPGLQAGGDIYMIGGGTRTEEIIRRLGHAAGGKNAKVVIAPWATALPKESIELLRQQFSIFEPKSVSAAPFFPDEYDPDYGSRCKELMLFHEPIQLFDAVARRKFLADISDATLLYFTGGSQNRILKVFAEDAEIAAAIRDFHARGGVYAGTSAGTAAVPQLMMNGKVVQLADGTDMAVVAGGMGLLPPGVFVDQHFIQRGRFNRLRNLVVPDRTYVGIGISESTMAVIRADGMMEVVGDSKVVVYFYDQADSKSPLQEVWLGRGTHFDLNARKIVKEDSRFRRFPTKPR